MDKNRKVCLYVLSSGNLLDIFQKGRKRNMIKLQHQFEVGQQVKIRENGEVVDVGILRYVSISNDQKQVKVEFESKRNPSLSEEYMFFPQLSGWKMLLCDPMAGYHWLTNLYVLEPMPAK